MEAIDLTHVERTVGHSLGHVIAEHMQSRQELPRGVQNQQTWPLLFAPREGYRLSVWSTQPGDFDYQFDVSHAPEADESSLTLGVPAWGNLEEFAALDRYSFMIPAPTQVTITGSGCPSGTTTTLHAPGLVHQLGDPCAILTRFFYPGVYILEVAANGTGSYTIQVSQS